MRIYFDQFVWVNLARAKDGKEEGYAPLLQIVEETSSAGIHRFYFSYSHFAESIKRQNTISREKLLELIFRITKFNSILVWSQIMLPEVENAVRIRVGLPPVDLELKVFGNQIGHIFGAKPSIVSKDGTPLPDEQQKEILDRVNGYLEDPAFMARLHTHAEFTRAGKDLWKQDDDLAKQLRGMIAKEYAHRDKRKRKDIVDARFFIDIVRDRLLYVCLKLGVDFKEFTKVAFRDRESAKKFLQDMPTLNTFHELNHYRNANGRIKENDLYDLAALSIAVPYCDVVFTERQWSKFLNQSGIAKLYSTRVNHNPEEIGAWLSED